MHDRAIGDAIRPSDGAAIEPLQPVNLYITFAASAAPILGAWQASLMPLPASKPEHFSFARKTSHGLYGLSFGACFHVFKADVLPVTET